MDIDDLSGEKERTAERIEKGKIYLQNSFRQCFMSDVGQRVLLNILQEAGYFDTNRETTEDLAVLNFVKLNILRKIGLLKPNNVDSYVRKLFEIPIKGEQQDG